MTIFDKGDGMMEFGKKTVLGRTGLSVGRLGISSSFGAPASALEMAFERGCNYFTWGTFVKGRSGKMEEAIRNIAKKGKRQDLVVAMLTYAHMAQLMGRTFHRGLKALGTDYIDILVLGYYNRRPPQRVLDRALRLKEQGLVRFLGITSHNRKLFPELAREGLLDLFHVRYNAAHRGAETETFPYLTGDKRPGIVTFTATRWGKLLEPKRMPPGEGPPSAVHCYRFVLSNPAVDVCMMGARNMEQMQENLAVLETGPLSDDEMERMRRIGDHVRSAGKIFEL